MTHLQADWITYLCASDLSQPPPATLIVVRLLPVVGHQLTSPAAGVQATPPTLLVTLVLYLTESAKNASSAVTRLRRSDLDRKSTRLNSSHLVISYAIASLKTIITT